MKYRFTFRLSDDTTLDVMSTGIDYADCARKARLAADAKSDKNDEYVVKLISGMRQDLNVRQLEGQKYIAPSWPRGDE